MLTAKVSFKKQFESLQGQLELKVKQLEEAQNTKFKPEASCRSLPSTPCKENKDSWALSNLSQELEESRRQLKLKDQQILQLRAQVCSSSNSSQNSTPPQTSVNSSPNSEFLPLEAKLFKSSLQIAERSKNSSISFQVNSKINFLQFSNWTVKIS